MKYFCIYNLISKHTGEKELLQSHVPDHALERSLITWQTCLGEDYDLISEAMRDENTI